MFDLGDIYNLSSRDILKLSHIFISHTHMDHFAGFDRLLRIILGREKELYIYGPEGFLKNIEGKLSGYSWNLVKNFSNQLMIHAIEIGKKSLISQKYICKNGFKATGAPVKQMFTHHIREIHAEPSFNINVSILDHGIPSLSFALKEKFRINIRKDVLEEMDLLPGKWLSQLKKAIFENKDPSLIIKVPHEINSITTLKEYKLKDLCNRLAIITEGQKIAYVADAAYTPSNAEKIVKLTEKADHLFIESAFLEKDIDHALKKKHLTAWQAGKLAGLAGVKCFTLFHFSPRYQDSEALFYDEADKAYRKYKNRD